MTDAKIPSRLSLKIYNSCNLFVGTVTGEKDLAESKYFENLITEGKIK
jgi:hypothetical protein